VSDGVRCAAMTSDLWEILLYLGGGVLLGMMWTAWRRG
jgi:hypothetical protein